MIRLDGWGFPTVVPGSFPMGISVWQILVILLIVLILFGAGKLPRVMGDIAKGVKSFKSGLKDEKYNIFRRD